MASLVEAVISHGAEPLATLSLAAGLPPVTRTTSIADGRRNYLKLASILHPDKLRDVSRERATECFQLLVRAFEAFSALTKKKSAARGKKATPPARPAEGVTTTKVKQTSTSKKAFAAKEEEAELSSEDEADNLTAIPPAVSTSRTPIGEPRTGSGYTPTIIGCPHCRTPWEPDSRPQYSLVMGQWGMKVHCQLCLFVFGAATALHSCPHCNHSIDYDSSMYDGTVSCVKCKKKIGFPYFPVNQMLIDQIRLNEWKEKQEDTKKAGRDERAKRRGGDAAEETLLLSVGTCIMEDECPICHKRVVRNHKSHVEECMVKGPPQPKKCTTTAGSGKSAAKASPTRAVTPAARKPKAPIKRSRSE